MAGGFKKVQQLQVRFSSTLVSISAPPNEDEEGCVDGGHGEPQTSHTSKGWLLWKVQRGQLQPWGFNNEEVEGEDEEEEENEDEEEEEEEEEEDEEPSHRILWSSKLKEGTNFPHLAQTEDIPITFRSTKRIQVEGKNPKNVLQSVLRGCYMYQVIIIFPLQ